MIHWFEEKIRRKQQIQTPAIPVWRKYVTILYNQGCLEALDHFPLFPARSFLQQLHNHSGVNPLVNYPLRLFLDQCKPVLITVSQREACLSPR